MKVEITLGELLEVLRNRNTKAMDGCKGCKYDMRGALEEPCKSCARNHGDYYERENEE